MTRLKQSWKSDESIFEMFEDKPIAGAQLKSLTGMIPIFRMLADVYYTVKEGKQEEAQEGEENAPCCLRRFFPKVGPLINPEFDIDINPVKVTDFGNIEI